MNKQHNYHVTTKWTGNNGTGTSGYKDFERDHVILVNHKNDILASSDPAFRGDGNRHNPEELLLASLSSCHMLWYLHLCSEAGIIVVDYSDNASAIMEENADGGGRFTEVILHPQVTVTDISMAARANDLHKRANELCFIAGSVNFPVRHQSITKTV